MVGVHRGAQSLALGTDAFYQQVFHLRIGEAPSAGERRRLIRPIGDGSDRPNPHRGTLQPGLPVQITGRVARRVALCAARNFLDEILTTSGFDRG